MSYFYVLARVVKDVSTSFAEDLNTPPLTLFFFTNASLAKRTRYSLLLFHHHVNERLCLSSSPMVRSEWLFLSAHEGQTSR